MFFDASEFASGLNAAFDATQTHFTFLDDNEINGAPNEYWLAQPGENLHVSIQNDNRTKVAHYFYNRQTNSWRCHLRNNQTPIPYGTHTHANLRLIQDKAVAFGWPPGAAIIQVQRGSKQAKQDAKQRKKQAEEAKKQRNLKLMEEVYEPRRAAPRGLKPVRFQPPPAGKVTDAYIRNLIASNSADSLEYLFFSDDWPLDKWESTAWATMMDWLTSP